MHTEYMQRTKWTVHQSLPNNSNILIYTYWKIFTIYRWNKNRIPRSEPWKIGLKIVITRSGPWNIRCFHAYWEICSLFQVCTSLRLLNNPETAPTHLFEDLGWLFTSHTFYRFCWQNKFVDFVVVVVVVVVDDNNNKIVYIINLLLHGCLVHTILFTRETFHSLVRYAHSFVKCLPRS